MNLRRWLAGCAVWLVACGRTELEPFADDTAANADAGVDAAPDAAHTPADASCESGRWRFGPIVTYASPPFAGGENPAPILSAGDFDGDGTLDLLGLFAKPQSIAVWRNLGDGTFVPGTTFAVAAQPYAVAVGDFNRDGLADFVLGFADYLDVVEVFTNRGDGSFALTSSFAVADGAWVLAVADFNGDGAPDLALSNGFEQLSVALNRGDGTFLSAVSYATGTLVEEMAVGDVNGDGALDIVSTSAPYQTPTVDVILNRGDGTFGAATSYPGICGDTGPIALGDFNGDGRLDVVRSCWEGANAVAVRMNNGDGTFGSETSYSAGPWPWGITVNRFLTTDGAFDIAASPILDADYGGTGVALLPGAGDGTFGKVIGAGSPTSNTIVSGDFNGDGHPDIAFSTYSAFGVVFFVCE